MIIKIFRKTAGGILKITLDETGLELYQSKKWNIYKDNKTFYLYGTSKGKHRNMPRILLNIEHDKKMVAYHVNHDGLDNRLENLIAITPAQRHINVQANKQVAKTEQSSLE